MPALPFTVSRRLVALAVVALAAATPARAQAPVDERAEIERLAATGQHAQALEQLGPLLEARPRDPRLRFLQGVLLAEGGRPADAIEVFRRLAADYPEIPEPHNNLAVLYAAAGEYDKARAALQAALRANPDYAVAHQNLGDVLAQLARQSYERALQLDPANAEVRPKIELLRRVVEPAGPPRAASR